MNATWPYGPNTPPSMAGSNTRGRIMNILKTEARVEGLSGRFARIVKAGVATVALLGGMGVVSVAAAPAAQAWAWDPHVILNGRVSCPAWGGPFDYPTWMYVEGNTGDAGWASLGAGGTTKPYSFNMTRVPSGRSEWVSISYGCSASGRHTTAFGVSRPSSGIYATRNIY